MAKENLSVTNTDREIAEIMGFKQRLLHDAFVRLNEVSRTSHLLDQINAVMEDTHWSDSHDRMLMRITLAGCLWVRVLTSDLGQQRKEPLRRLERFIDSRCSEDLRMTRPDDLTRFFARYRSGHYEGGRSGPPSSRSRPGLHASSEPGSSDMVSPLMANTGVARSDSAPPEGQ